MFNYFSYNRYTLLLVFCLSSFPNISHAKDVGKILVSLTTTLLNPLVMLLFLAGVVVFFWGVVKYIGSLGEKSKTDGRWLMVWGVVALFVMVSVWGLVNVLIRTVGFNNEPVDSIVIP